MVETGGTKVKDILVRPDLTDFIWPDCIICKSGEGGASHTRRGAVYQGTCTVCEETLTLGRYDGETGDSAFHRIHGEVGHRKSIMKGNIKNAFAKHISIYHPEREGDCNTFKFKVKSTYKTCLERQVTEGVIIHNSKADIILNGKSESHQPLTRRVNMTNIPKQRGLN